MRHRVLCVDDEPRLLEALEEHLDLEYDVVLASGGEEGLRKLVSEGPFAVVLSDMRMPGMNGAAFLARVREHAPDAVRMLLTGYTEVSAAIDAVNQGNIFRFLTKPCPPTVLSVAFRAAVKQHELITAEHVLLEQTLRGSIKALIDALALSNPAAFGRANRLKQLAADLAAKLGLQDRWRLEVAAMLSQLGTISLPAETIERLRDGRALHEDEKEMVARVPQLTEQILSAIPRLEPVREMIRLTTKLPRVPREVDPLILLGAKILRLVTDFDLLDNNSQEAAIATMRGRGDTYDAGLLSAFAEMLGAKEGLIREVSLRGLQIGMVFAEDVRARTGMLIVARGYEVNLSFLERLRNFLPGTIVEPLKVTH